MSSSRELRPLLTKATALSALQRHFEAVAPPHFAQFSQVAGLQAGTLIIAASNAAVAAKLRQLAPELVTLLQNRGYEVSRIHVKVQVSFNPGQPEVIPRKLSQTARNALNDLSRNLGDSPLKLALKKMLGSKD